MPHTRTNTNSNTSFPSFFVPVSLFCVGATKAIINNRALILNNSMEDVAFSLAINALKDSGIMKMILGSSLVAGSFFGGAITTLLAYMLYKHFASERPNILTSLLLFNTTISCGALSFAAGGYGAYKLSEGVSEEALAAVLCMNRV
jgi:hypothetical protein